MSCIISGKIKKDKLFPSQRYILTASVKNCFINNINVFDDAEVSGEIIKDKILFKLNSTDNTLKVKSLWQPVEKYIFTEIILKKENVNIGAITTGVYSKIKIMKDKKLNIVGSYTLNNVIYDKKSLAEVIEGKFNLQDKKEIIFEGIVSRRKTDYKYQILLPLQPQKKYGLLKLTGITLLPGFKDENVYNAELTFNSDFIFTGEVMLEGKLYNDTSEIIISSATVLLNKKTLTLATRLKNVEFKNQHIMGNIKIEVLTLENQVIHINSVVSDLWINNYPIEKIMIQAVYNIKKNEIDFIPVKLYGKNDTTVSGKLIILPQNLSFVEYKIYNNSGEMLILIGDIGRKGDLLKINVTKIPIETFTSIIGMSKLDVKGVMDANIEVLSYNPIKSDYRLTSNFIVKNVEIVGMKVERITGRISNDEDSIYFENIDFVFNNAQKVRLLGEYYIKNQNLNFSLSSSKCALSIFNNFYNFIKTADGTLTVDVKIKGTKNLPRLYGYLLIQKGKVQFNKYLKYLDNVNLELKFEGNKVKIERCSGYYEQTKLVISGVYDINNSSEFYIHTEGGNGVFVTLEELSFPVGRFFKIVKGEKTFPSNGNLHFDLNLKKYKSEILATGSIVMNNTYFTYPGISGRGIIKKYNNFFYDITLAANNNVWYENETISANITGKLNFKYLKNMQKSNINGKIEVLRGKVNFLNTPLNIKFGGMEILNRDIYLELEAETDIITTEQEKI
ncbi:MAG: translocation/assembly module TamB domain-containing protein, partial [Endomicrobia bacterium]|nr:translocation/assembly module TamB domain-containing protein [Endomicrobiia bacterium]